MGGGGWARDGEEEEIGSLVRSECIRPRWRDRQAVEVSEFRYAPAEWLVLVVKRTVYGTAAVGRLQTVCYSLTRAFH